VPGFSFQPAELSKFALICYFAARQAQYEIEPNFTAKQLYTGYAAVTGILVLLILFEPNLSMAVLIVGTSAVVIYLTGIRIKPIVVPAIGGVIGVFLVAWFTPYMRSRVDAYIAGIVNPMSSSYHVKQSLIGIGQGGFAGVGLGGSTQKHFFLPEPFKDFI